MLYSFRISFLFLHPFLQYLLLHFLSLVAYFSLSFFNRPCSMLSFSTFVFFQFYFLPLRFFAFVFFFFLSFIFILPISFLQSFKRFNISHSFTNLSSHAFHYNQLSFIIVVILFIIGSFFSF